MRPGSAVTSCGQRQTQGLTSSKRRCFVSRGASTSPVLRVTRGLRAANRRRRCGPHSSRAPERGWRDTSGSNAHPRQWGACERERQFPSSWRILATFSKRAAIVGSGTQLRRDVCSWRPHPARGDASRAAARGGEHAQRRGGDCPEKRGAHVSLVLGRAGRGAEGTSRWLLMPRLADSNVSAVSANCFVRASATCLRACEVFDRPPR